MSTKHKNPYKRGNYKEVFNAMKRKQVFTKNDLFDMTAEMKDKSGKTLTVAKRNAIVGVMLSPRDAETKRTKGDCRGNFSAMGHIYYVELLKKRKGEPQKYRLRYRKEPLLRRKRVTHSEINQESSPKSTVSTDVSGIESTENTETIKTTETVS